MVDFLEGNDSLVVRLNGGIHKNSQECVFNVGTSYQYLMKNACKQFNFKEKISTAKLYNKNGVAIYEEDLEYTKSGDILYLALNGEQFSYSSILDDYEITKKIGQGGFGSVMLGKHRETNKEVAIKYMDMSEQMSNAKAVTTIYKEAEALKKLKHKSIIDLHHAFVEGKQLIMIMEYAGGGELLEMVEKQQQLEEPDARHIFLQILNAIQYCHGRGVVHRDLKLENILIKNHVNLDVKVVDFGIAGVCQSNKVDKVDAGSIAYMPPECFGNVPVDTSHAIDVWAIGLIFYAMLYGTLPFYNDDEKIMINKTLNSPLKFPNDQPISEQAKEIMTKMLEKDPEKRVELLDIMETEYYQLNDDEMEDIFNKNKKELDEKQANKQKQIEEEQKLSSDFANQAYIADSLNPPTNQQKNYGSKSPSRKAYNDYSKQSGSKKSKSGTGSVSKNQSHGTSTKSKSSIKKTNVGNSKNV